MITFARSTPSIFPDVDFSRRPRCPVYATCLFCNHDLRRNDVLEHFPVGRRLAHEEAKGRLWVICRHCERWNLTPLEARWEAIEEAERSYRAARLRIATETSAWRASTSDWSWRFCLALEMVLHDDDERCAMEGVVAALEQRWRGAERIAAIADSLLLPGATETRLAALERRTRTGGDGT